MIIKSATEKNKLIYIVEIFAFVSKMKNNIDFMQSTTEMDACGFFINCVFVNFFQSFKKFISFVLKVIVHFPSISFVFSLNDCSVKLFV